MTKKQQQAYDVLVSFGEGGATVRQAADKMETDEPGSERWSKNELRGLYERMEKDGNVVSYKNDAGDVYYQPKVSPVA